MSKRQLEAAFLKGKVSALQEHGMSDRQISSSVGVPRSTIYKWKRSNFSLHRKPGSGRPRKTSPQSDDSIVSLARSDPNMSSSEIRQGSEACFCPYSAAPSPRSGFSKPQDTFGSGVDRQSQTRASSVGYAPLPLAFSMGSSRLE